MGKERTKTIDPKLIAVLLICALLLVLLVSATLIKGYSNRLVDRVSNDLSEQYAKEINAHMEANVSSTLNSLTEETLIIESALSQIDPLNTEKIAMFLEKLQEGRDQYVCILAADGTFVDATGRSTSMVSISFAGQLMLEKSYLSDNESLNGKSYVMYGNSFDQPIDGEDGQYWAVVIGITNDSLADRVVLTSEYSGSFTSITQKDGFFIIKNPNEGVSGRNEFSILEEAGDITKEEGIELRKAMERGETVLLRAPGGGQDFFIYYAPMKNTNWVLVNHIPAEFIQASVKTVQSGLTTMSYLSLGVLASIAVIMLVLLINAIIRQAEGAKLLAEAYHAAEKANKAKTVFLNNMSHDIRTPMNAIMGLLTIARKQNRDAEVDVTLSKIGSSSNYLLSLINDVLDISRIESGKMKLNLKPAVLERISGDSIAIIQNTLSDRKIDFIVERSEGTRTCVMADKLRIQEILVNIMNNAVKFTNDGGTICFRETIREQGDESINVSYTISDTGVGMSKEFMQNLFNEFEQEANDARTQYKGTGLGMAITKRLVDLMGGSLKVESEKNRGTTFTIDLCLKKTDEIPEEEKELAAEAGAFSTEGLQVLLAEDNDMNAEIAEFMLNENGMQVKRAVDGEEAVRLFKENPPGTFDVILMDVMMPKMNGYEATKAIRQMDGRPDALKIPIIAMTANAFAEDEQKALESGMNAHLAKPINAEQVIKTISRYVGKAGK